MVNLFISILSIECKILANSMMNWNCLMSTCLLVLTLKFYFFLSRTAVKLAVGGFSMGAATALHAGTCHVSGKYGNGEPFPANLSAVVGLSGWLPCAKFGSLFI